LTRAGLGYLCSSANLVRLRHLGLSHNHLRTPREWSPPQGGTVALESLDLTENGLTEDGIRVLTALPGLGQIARLNLGHNEIGNGGAAVLAEWPGASTLRVLRLADNRIGDDGARSLARSTYLHHLTELDLSDNPIHDPGAGALLKAAGLSRLRRLGLPRLGLTPKTRRALTVRYPG
jgi:Leucine-rich repeat (LRR) protein